MSPSAALVLVAGVAVSVIGWPGWAVVNGWRCWRFRRALARVAASPRIDLDGVIGARRLAQTRWTMASGPEEEHLLEVWTSGTRLTLRDTDPTYAATLAALQARGLARRIVSGGTVGGVGQALIAPLSLAFWAIVLALVLRRAVFA